ncbi:formylglycine-generating enzyme family protein [uncultured Desulfobacter sp.]|uniref:formylglycine-generating enzyme family protein n=1 Tax=uncultured Desulfobacter sp. TaxID=240139 RepID=UPI0029F540A6|nr:formylglycine-generating enzyme family protein [uncultured Desulfobacter sp.]
MIRRYLKYKQEKSTPGVGLSDLIDIYRKLGPEGLYRAAGAAGFEEKKPDESNESEKEEVHVSARGSSTSALPDTGLKQTPVFDNTSAPVLFWRVTQKEKKKRTGAVDRVPDWYRKAGILTPERTRIKKEEVFLPPFEPLIRWERLWPFLKKILGRRLDTGDLDIPKAVDAASRLKPLTQISFEKKQGWAGSCLVVFDYSPQMVPFRKDFYILHRGISKLRGKTGYHGVIVADSPLCKVRMIGGKSQKAYFPIPLPGTPVLILSGLGLLSDQGHIQKAWKMLGRRFKRQGIRPVVLTPASPEFWDGDHRKYFSMVFWDKHTRLSGNHYASGSPGLQPSGQQIREKVKRLVSLMAPCLGVSAGLMRRICSLVPEENFHACVQALAWNCKEYVSADAMSCLVRADAVPAVREYFDDLKPSLKLEMFELAKAAHARECPSVRFAENYIWEELLGREDTATRFFLNDIIKSLDHPDAVGQDSIRAYLNGLVNRMLKWEIRDDQVFAAWIKLHCKDLETEQVELPDKLDISSFDWLLEKNKMQVLELGQQGENLVISLPDQGSHRPGGLSLGPSPLSRIRTRMGQVKVVFEDKEKAISLPLDFKSGRTPFLSLKGQKRMVLESDWDLIRLEALEKPDWAFGMGRDKTGLFVDIKQENKSRRAYYLAPEKFDAASLLGKEPRVYTPSSKTSYGIEKGFFWDKAEFLSFLKNGFSRPEWAEAVGMDEFGLWADIVCKDIRQKMRWIFPGAFLMGSPEDEPEREKREHQHEVVVTRGFWLADTACTQALWQAVMKDNPSNFKGGDLPVDNVSWEDCQSFLERINGLVPGFNFGLPIEAQWEYACRAGTQTPFSFGRTVSTDQANFDGNYPYAGGAKGEFRKTTIPVKALPCNDWGLYQMHGNVFEWCQDWHGDYDLEHPVDPVGPDTGVYRVLRGGSWGYFAGGLRSACRVRGWPSSRNNDIGFRLAQGHL